MSQLNPVLSGHAYPHKHVEHAYLPGEKLFFRITRVAREFSKRHLLRNASGSAISQSIVIIPQQTGIATTKLETPVRSQAERDYLADMGYWHHRRQRRHRRL